MSKSTKEAKFLIKITNFINPHLFNFKLDHSDFDTDEILAKQAAEISSEYPVGYHPQLHQAVLAYIPTWKKWVRAEVDMIFGEGSKKRYIVWCCDEGIPAKLESRFLLPVQIGSQIVFEHDFEKLPKMTYVGGLARCVPIEKRLNYAQRTDDVWNVSNFSEFSLTIAQRIIDEAAEIYFTPRQKMGKHIFGDIRITEFKGHKTDLLHELVKSGDAKVDKDYIPTGTHELKTIVKKRYEDNMGRLNVQTFSDRDMVMPTYGSGGGGVAEKCAQSMISVYSDMDDEDQKVLDWSRYNIETAKKMKKNVQRDFDNVLRTLGHYEVSIGHDSVFRPSCFTSISCFGTSMGSFQSLQNVGSQSSLESTSFVAKPPRGGGMSRLAERMKKASIQTCEKIDECPKKITYIPSGFEPDLDNFQKYNRIF